jgi:hypothetical protein
MITLKPRLWRTLSHAALAGAGALTLAACEPGGEAGGETGAAAGAHGEAGESGAEHGATPTGEAGEAGISGAFEGLSAEQRAAVRLQQLKGFYMAADTLMTEPDLVPAGILIGQGILEVFEAFPSDMAGYDVTPAQAAFRLGQNGGAQPEMARNLSAAMAGVDARITASGVSGTLIAARMVDVTEGLYRHVDRGEGVVDAVEYQHSFGAALAARDALVRDEARLRRANAAAYAEALRELDALIALFPGPEAPETPAALQQVLAQGSRAKLVLSSLQPG